MKEGFFDILVYLFDNYFSEEDDIERDRDVLRRELLHAGFRQIEIAKALDWLDGLMELQRQSEVSPVRDQKSMRIYTDGESEKLDCDSRGFLLFLEQLGVIDHSTRELVIDRVMALDGGEVDLDQLKWVILIVLFNQPGREAAFAWMEDLVREELTSSLH